MPVLVKKKVPPLEKKKQMKLKVSREKKILKYENMRDEKSMKTKSKLLGFVCVFRKINKSDKLLSRLIKEKVKY